MNRIVRSNSNIKKAYPFLVFHKLLQIIYNTVFEILHSIFIKSGNLLPDGFGNFLKIVFPFFHFIHPLNTNFTFYTKGKNEHAMYLDLICKNIHERNIKIQINQYLCNLIVSLRNFVHFARQFKFDFIFSFLGQSSLRLLPRFVRFHSLVKHFLKEGSKT